GTHRAVAGCNRQYSPCRAGAGAGPGQLARQPGVAQDLASGSLGRPLGSDDLLEPAGEQVAPVPPLLQLRPAVLGSLRFRGMPRDGFLEWHVEEPPGRAVSVLLAQTGEHLAVMRAVQDAF